jgi:hypothetical protein
MRMVPPPMRAVHPISGPIEAFIRLRRAAVRPGAGRSAAAAEQNTGERFEMLRVCYGALCRLGPLVRWSGNERSGNPKFTHAATPVAITTLSLGNT